ncbi:MAG: YesL family protein [Eubacterium sp.]|nr:YesL family protein [Eubacterium sp.]
MFRYDSKFWSVVGVIGDIIMINILYLLSCIPVITIGAATSALYSVMRKQAKKETGYMVRDYLKAMKENFKKSTVIWLIFLVLFGLIYGDLIIVKGTMNDSKAQSMALGFFLVSFLLALAICIYALVLQSGYENTVKNTLKNATILMLAQLPWTAVILLVTLSPALALLVFPKGTGVILVGMFACWFSVAALINSYIFNRIFEKMIPKEA